MPGFGGATLAGFMLGVLSIPATAKIGIVLIVLAVPLADAAYSILRRVVDGKNPVWGDNKHLHHRLLRLGWSKRGVARLYWMSAAVMGALAALVLSVDTRALLVTGISMVALVGLALMGLSSFEAPEDADGLARHDLAFPQWWLRLWRARHPDWGLRHTTINQPCRRKHGHLCLLYEFVASAGTLGVARALIHNAPNVKRPA